MQRNNLNENSSQTDKPVKKRQADINLKTRTNLGFTFFDCGISGQGEVNQYTKDGKKAADVNFKLDKPDPNNSSLCYISLFTGYAHLLQTAPNKAHMKSTIDAGGVKNNQP